MVSGFNYLYQYIDVEMLPAKMTFFFTDGFFGSTESYMNVFYVSLGLTPTHAGLITGISLLVSSLFNPVWSTLADITGYRKLIFIILCIGTGAAGFSIPWIEQVVAVTNTTTCYPNTTINSTVVPCTSKRHLMNVETLFHVMLTLNIIAWIFYTSLRCYVDGTITNVVNTRSTKKDYGPQRAVSCAGYACFNFLTGIIADHYKPANMSSYTAIFFVFLPCVICTIPFGCILINQAKWETADEQKKLSRDVIVQFFSLFRKLDFIMFLFSVMIEGLVLNTFACFFFMLMEHEIGSSKTLMSFAFVLGVACEIVMFSNAARVIRYIGGPIICLIIGIFSFCPRFLIMSYIVNPWHVLATQPLHAFGMALAWTSIVEHTYEIVPNDIKVTAIAFMSSIVFFATSAISNMVGGVLFDVYGGRALFRSVGILAGAWSLFMTVYFGIRHYRTKSGSISVTSDPKGFSKPIQDDIVLENSKAMDSKEQNAVVSPLS